MFLFRKKIKNDYGFCIDEKNLNRVVDYTLLDPTATKKDLEKFLCVAYKNKYYSVCVNPINVAFAKRYIEYKFKGNLLISCVIGFPLGENTTETKLSEIKQAIKHGANEFDVVAPISRIKDADWAYVKNEISRLRRATRKQVLKVIIETASLTKTEIEKVSLICSKCKVDFVKTCTGFADGGASPEVVEIIRNSVKKSCGIKASGGISSRAQAINLLRAGATRIGTSREI